MRIFRLMAQNIKNLTSVDITPPADGSAVIIRGQNGAGKTATIDSIGMAIGDKKLVRPIRDGQIKAEVEIHLDEYTVRRTWTNKSGPSGYLQVASKEGAIFKSPQALMDRIRGRVGFDPLKWAGLTAKEQIAMLKELDPSLDFADHDAERQKIYQERTTTNSKLRDVEGELAGMPAPAEGSPTEEVSMQEALDHLQKLTDQEQRFAVWEWEFSAMQQVAEAGQQGITDLEQRIQAMQIQLTEAKAMYTQATEAMSDFQTIKPYCPDQAVIQEARQKIQQVEGINAAVRAGAAYAETEKAKIALTEKAAAQTAEIKRLDELKLKTISEAKYPIDGLIVQDGDVLFGGIPFSQLAYSEKVKVSTAIGMAMNPTLKVLVVHEGSLLDDAGLAAIQSQAKEKGYQLWIECVGEGGVGIVIEEGKVKKETKA